MARFRLIVGLYALAALALGAALHRSGPLAMAVLAGLLWLCLGAAVRRRAIADGRYTPPRSVSRRSGDEYFRSGPPPCRYCAGSGQRTLHGVHGMKVPCYCGGH
jgi:hypothetical protein